MMPGGRLIYERCVAFLWASCYNAAKQRNIGEDVVGMIKQQPAQEAIQTVLTRGVKQVEKEAELRRMLLEGNEGQPLRVKLGVDPTHYELTIGHAVVFRKLRQFQQMGHKAVVVIGDWTARLGDPSGREEARQALTAEQVRENAKTYFDQFFRIVDRDLTEVHYQSEWFDSFNLADALRLLSHKTVAQMLDRDDFSKRYKSGTEIYLSEFMYPLLQGYDSVMLRSDVEIGGTDQTFNLLVGRELQPIFGQAPQQILTVELIVGLDGYKKMGKSLSNYIAMTAPVRSSPVSITWLRPRKPKQPSCASSLSTNCLLTYRTMLSTNQPIYSRSLSRPGWHPVKVKPVVSSSRGASPFIPMVNLTRPSASTAWSIAYNLATVPFSKSANCITLRSKRKM